MFVYLRNNFDKGRAATGRERNDHGQLRSGAAGRFLPNGRHLWKHPEQLADVEFYRDSRIKQLTGKRKEPLNTFLLILANNKKET